MKINKLDKIAFIGAGKMAEAIFSRLISQKEIDPNNVLVSDISKDRLRSLKSTYKVNTTSSNTEAFKYGHIVIIAVKPQQIKDVLVAISSINNERLVISIAAGIKTSLIESYLNKARVIRVMPNTAALVGNAISAISKGVMATEVDVILARTIFEAVGRVIEIEEDMQNAVTAISGSGPAYFFYFIENLEEAAVSLGFNREIAHKLAVSVAIGSSELLKTNDDPKMLREMVTSKGGTTQAAIEQLERDDLSSIIRKAVQKANKRANELVKE